MTKDNRSNWDATTTELTRSVWQWAEAVQHRITQVPNEFPEDEWRRVWDTESQAAEAERRHLLRALLATYWPPFSDVDSENAGVAMASLVADLRSVVRSLGWEPHRAAISSRLRTFIYRRDGYACVDCHEDDITRLTIDHRVPVVLGGSNEPDNLRTLCKSCNSRKGTDL